MGTDGGGKVKFIAMPLNHTFYEQISILRQTIFFVVALWWSQTNQGTQGFREGPKEGQAAEPPADMEGGSWQGSQTQPGPLRRPQKCRGDPTAQPPQGCGGSLSSAASGSVGVNFQAAGGAAPARASRPQSRAEDWLARPGLTLCLTRAPGYPGSQPPDAGQPLALHLLPVIFYFFNAHQKIRLSILEREEGRERGRNIDQLPPARTQTGTKPVTEARALMGTEPATFRGRE